MSYFLSPENLLTNQSLTIAGEEAAHILLSRRMKIGERIKLQGPDGKRYECEVMDAKKQKLEVKVLNEILAPEEYQTRITLFQSVISEKALDFIFQKATELGGYGITLFNSANTATKLTKEQFEKKQERWNKILWEAAKQSDRRTIPELNFIESFDDMINTLSAYEITYVLDISGTRIKKQEAGIKNTALVIGPEGGLTQSEITQLSSPPSFHLLNISNFTLRAETAAISALSVLQNTNG